MSNMKTRNYPFYYEGVYWSSREKYAAWVKVQKEITISQSKSSNEGGC